MMNHKLQLFWIVIASIGLVFGGTSCQVFAPAYTYKGTLLEPPKPLPDFELANTEGQPFHLSDTKGNIVLVYFGYTFCPDVCPLTLADVKQALAGLDSKEQIKVIFISVDPERDTPELLSRYLNAFDPEFIGLTDDFDKIAEVMTTFGAYAEKETVADSAAGYLVNHSARLFLVDPDQNLRLLYSFGFKPEDLQSDLAELLKQPN